VTPLAGAGAAVTVRLTTTPPPSPVRHDCRAHLRRPLPLGQPIVARQRASQPDLQANAGRDRWLGWRVFEASKTSAARRTGWIRGAWRRLGRARRDGKRRRRARRGEAGRVRWRRLRCCAAAGACPLSTSFSF
jgi:hypothetical protein